MRIANEPPSEESEYRRVVIPFRLVLQAIYFGVELDDGSKLNALLDTGAQATFVDTNRIGSVLRSGKSNVAEIETPITGAAGTHVMTKGVYVDFLNVKISPELKIPMRKSVAAINFADISQSMLMMPEVVLGASIFDWKPLKNFLPAWLPRLKV